MTKFSSGAFAALPLLLCATPVLADEATDNGDNAPIIATGLRPDAHGPAGLMGAHVHETGSVMVGLMWMHEYYGDANRSGTRAIADQAIADAGYSAKAASMTMDMAMLHLMWAPSDRVTFMVAPSWMRMSMVMQGLPMPTGMIDEGGGAGHSHGGHMLSPGQRMTHAVEGMGDTQLGALVSFSRKPGFSGHVGLMVSAPTGNVTRKDPSGAYLHYMMQGGSGTWDFNPSITLHGLNQTFGWGAQAGYLLRGEHRNKAGFRFGNRFTAAAWLSKPLTPRVSVSARLAYSDEGIIRGHYNATHGHSSPVDIQANYGGQRVEAGLGVNAMVGSRLRLGAEASVPVYQKLNGIQLPKKFGMNVSASIMF